MQSPLASIFIWADKNATVNSELSPNDIFCNIAKIHKIKSKIFIFHGKMDNIINVRHSHLLFDKFTKCGDNKNNKGIWLVIAEKSKHNDMHLLVRDKNSPFAKRIQKFLELIDSSNLIETLFQDSIEKIFQLKKERENLEASFNIFEINRNEFKNEEKKRKNRIFILNKNKTVLPIRNIPKFTKNSNSVSVTKNNHFDDVIDNL